MADGGIRLAVKVAREMAETVRRQLIKQNLFDRSRCIVKTENYVLIPVLARPLDAFEVVEAELPSRKPLVETVLKASFDIVGSIAVINDMDMPRDKAEALAVEIVRHHPRVKTVLQKTGMVAGEERVAAYHVLHGEPVTETVHRESGCVFKVDLAKAFFNPRLSGERLRVASQAGENEAVLDMFAGVGPFSIIIARKKPSTTVYAVEKNPAAHQYLLTNIKLNKVEERVKPFLGDAAEIVPTHDTCFNRIIMNLPHQSIKYLPTALEKAAPNATIHLYVVEERNKPSTTRQTIAEISENISVVGERVVKETSPKAVIKAYDLLVTKA
ncbi:MAG: class I SAM-dependent methyltransferase family protein [Candidatus Caldarchaeum sp.]